MPRTVRLKKRHVVLNTECDDVFKIHNATLMKMGLALETESNAFSSVQPSSEAPLEGNSILKAKRLLEQAFGVRLGGNKRDLPECTAEMDTGSHSLFIAYRDYWVSQMRQCEEVLAEQMENHEIKCAYVLIMEFYLRFAMQALRLDSPLRSDQQRRIFIEILSHFTVNLSKSEILGRTLQKNLFRAHTKWLDLLVNTANQIDQMNKAKPVLSENLEHLELLENKIKRYLVVCLTHEKFSQKKEWKGKLSESQLSETLRECEARILRGLKQTEIAEGIVELSVVIQKNDAFRQSRGISETDLVEYDLVEYGILTIQDACQQKNIIDIFDQKSPESRESKIKLLYALWNKTKIIYQFLSQIDNLVQSMGWLPLLFNVVNLDEVDNAINMQLSLCNMMFEICEKDDRFSSNTPLGKELCECTHAGFGTRNSLPKLATLQEPELLRAVFERMALNFNLLTRLGALSNCQVICNPFLQKTSTTSLEMTHKLTQLTIPRRLLQKKRSLPITGVTTASPPKTPVFTQNSRRGRTSSLAMQISSSPKNVAHFRTVSEPASLFSPSNKTEMISVKKKKKREKSKSEEFDLNSIQDINIERIESPVEKLKKKRENDTNDTYVAAVPYIRTFVTSLELSRTEINSAGEKFSTEPDYFESKHWSPFRRRAAEIVRKFILDQLGGFHEPPEGFVDVRPIWRQRMEEIAILRTLCIGANDDMPLLLFLIQMKISTATYFWPPRSRYNALIDDLEKLLTSYYDGELSASFKRDINDSLIAETEDLRKENRKTCQENKELRIKNSALRQDNQHLLTNYADNMKNLADKIDRLQAQLEKQGERHKNEVDEIKASFQPLFQHVGNIQNNASAIVADDNGLNCAIL